MSLIDTMEARLADISASMEAVITAAETETRNVSDDEQASIDGFLTEHRSVEAKIASLRDVEALRAKRAAVIPAATVTPAATTELRTEPYRKGGNESYFKDLYLQSVKGDRRAAERLTVNDRHRADKEQRAMSTTAGAGGEFAPPLWQIDEFVAFRRAGRVFADRLNHEVLPAGISSINIPKVTTGALTGTQGSQNTAVANRDFATTSVSAGINTVAGRVIISQQDLDQSPINLDSIILGDLTRDYALQLDTAVIAGVAGVSGINAITYTDATPTTGKLLSQVQAAIDAVHSGIFSPATAIIMRPDRWGRLLAAVDTAGRPLVIPEPGYGSFNAVGAAAGAVPQGYAGTLRSVPVYLDPSIPVNLGAGTNQDEIFVLDPAQITLYESAPKTEAFQETYADNLSVLIRFYAYYGLLANRLPKAISLIGGTGLIPYAYGV